MTNTTKLFDNFLFCINRFFHFLLHYTLKQLEFVYFMQIVKRKFGRSPGAPKKHYILSGVGTEIVRSSITAAAAVAVAK